MKKTLSIEGMSCKHCSARVQNALKAVAGVSSAEVSLESKSASVEGTALDDSALKAAVEDSGYEVLSILDA